MGVLRSDLFKDDPKLEACATAPHAHLLIGTPPGKHIAKIQAALEILRPDGPEISATEKTAMSYGPTTAAAVLNYKKTHAPPIINRTYQDAPDPIVGQMTIKAMDDDLTGNRRPASTLAVEKAVDRLPSYIDLTIRGLNELVLPGRRQSSLSDLAEDAVRRFFRSDPAIPSGIAEVGVIIGRYRILQQKLSELSGDLHINDLAKDLANQGDSGERKTAAYAVMSDSVDEKAGIYINPSIFEPLNELRRTGIILHEMGHFYLQMVEDRDPRASVAPLNIIGNNISYDFTAFQINFGQLFREDIK